MEVYQLIGYINMTKTLILFDNLSEEYGHQELWDPDKNKCLFSVSDLWESPEDAIIGRALHDGDDAYSLIEAGMRYSKEGYSSIDLTYVMVPEGKDMNEYIEQYLSKWKETQS